MDFMRLIIIKNFKLFTFLLITLIGLSFWNCSSAPPCLSVNKTVKTFEDAKEGYKRLRPYKAMAYAVDSEGDWVYGYAHGKYSQAIANERAMYECQKRLGRYKVNASCRLYAVGDNIVGE